MGYTCTCTVETKKKRYQLHSPFVCFVLHFYRSRLHTVPFCSVSISLLSAHTLPRYRSSSCMNQRELESYYKPIKSCSDSVQLNQEWRYDYFKAPVCNPFKFSTYNVYTPVPLDFQSQFSPHQPFVKLYGLSTNTTLHNIHSCRKGK